MKKIKIFIVIVLAGIFGSGVLTGNASAMVEEKGVKWYGREESNIVGQEMEKVAEEKCGEDGNCRRTIYRSLINSNTKYKAADLMSGQMLMITGVNPVKSEVSFIYNGRVSYKYRKLDLMQTYPSEIHIGWVDDGTELGYNSEVAIKNGFAGVTGTLHPIFEVKSSDKTQILPIDTEITVSDSQWNLSQNTNGRIYYIVYNTDGSGFWGYYNYKNCLSREGYYEGGACEVMTNGTYFDFFPVEKEVVEIERTVEVEKEVEKIVEVEKEVEKIVEVEKIIEVPVEVEKVVEVPVEVERVVEVPVEVERVIEVEKEIEVPVEVEKIVEVPVEVEKVVEVAVETEREVYVDREVPVEVAVEKTVEVPVEIEKIVEVEKAVEVPVEVEKEVIVETPSGGDENVVKRIVAFSAILVALDVVILWWFWPNRTEKEQQNEILAKKMRFLQKKLKKL